MRATVESVENAVLRIFVELDVPQDRALRYVALQDHWPQTHLRRTDLVEGVKGLVFSGELRLERRDGEAFVKLTAAGARRALAGGVAPDPLIRLAQQLLHSLAPARPAPLPHRRRDDPPAVFA